MVTFYDCVMKRQIRCRPILRYSEPALATLIPTKQTFATCLIFLLLGASFITTLIFWEYIAVNNAQGRSYHPAPFSLSRDGQRQLRSLERLLLPAEAAGMFVVEPADTRQSSTTETPPPLPKGCYAFSKDAPQVCRELDIPSLVGERKPNSEDRSLDKAVEVIFGTNQSAIRAAVTRTNQKLTKYLGNSKNSSREVLDDLIVSEESSLIGNYNYLPGGHWIPSTCLPRWKVAIIIPFRNRSHHLPVLLHHLIPFLQRQRLEFGIYVVEQANNLNFNRAMLMNIGFLESLNFTKWDCFIFHDVDHLPKNDRNYYGCSGMPRHFLSGSDRWKYKLPYENFFGAVTGLTAGQIRAINGFPNVYWGWGGEDDEIWNRCKETGLEITRVKGPKGHYDVITHHHHSAPPSKERMNLLKSFKPRFRKDGLNNVAYEQPTYTFHPLYVNISVNIQKVKGDYILPKPAPVKPAKPGKRFVAVAKGKSFGPRAVQAKPAAKQPPKAKPKPPQRPPQKPPQNVKVIKNS